MDIILELVRFIKKRNKYILIPIFYLMIEILKEIIKFIIKKEICSNSNFNCIANSWCIYYFISRHSLRPFNLHNILMNILGISCFYHDSAAALIKDGEVISSVQEERFSRKKHDSNFPSNSIKYILEENELKLNDLDHIVFYEKPFIKFERL